MRYIAALTPALLMLATPAMAEDVDPVRYPELAPEALLPPIIAALRGSLVDAYSIRDLRVCPAGKVKLKGGKPVRWSVQLSLNAKNSFGGYAGTTTYAVIFRDGQVSGRVVPTAAPGTDAIASLINSTIARQIARCPIVPDVTVQQLLSPGASALIKP